MSSATRSPRGRGGARGKRRPPRRRAARRDRWLRPLALAAVVLTVSVGVLAAGRPTLDDAVQELRLPLRHDDIIRQQAEDKELDPALIAAVIYQESRFRPRTSPAGAEGLMQLMPETAHFIARRTGGTRFELRDLDTPQVNIAYGSWYLRHLLDRYGQDEQLAVAAYNAGIANVDRWVAAAGGQEGFDADEHITFGETRAYVRGVIARRQEYRDRYADELGL